MTKKEKIAKAPKAESLLVELLTEELPPKSLQHLSDTFASELADGLRSRGLLMSDSSVSAFATPRRLAVRITHVLEKGIDKPVEQKIMPLSVARGADGEWTDVLKKKLTSLGRPQLAKESPNTKEGSDSLHVKSDGKTESVYLSTLEAGWPLGKALWRSLQDSVDQLPVPKAIFYFIAAATTEKFVRPVHGLLIIHGKTPLELPERVLGFRGGVNDTEGHRFLCKSKVRITSADEYGKILERDACVLADFAVRKERIRKELNGKTGGAKILCDDALLDEVTALVEWPAVYVGTFDKEFLEVPQECLILSMQQHQRYFPLADSSGKLQSRFLIISNMQVADPGNIVRGNERVLRARLSDAKFFFNQDRKTRLESRVAKLAHMVYHSMLGSELDRVERIRILAERIAHKLGADVNLANRAALLSKADLLTDMVGEFPELQGVMGRYYALYDEEPKEVAQAIEAHYRPRFSGDVLPEEPVAIAVALADKLDTLVGMRGKGIVPTGDKDPFGLRRHAVGVLRILVEKQLPLDLHDLLEGTKQIYDPLDQTLPGGVTKRFLLNETVELVFEFILERLRSYLRDREFAPDEIEAVVSQRPTRIDLVLPRLEAVRAFRKLPEAESLAIANKRIRNILKQAPPTDGAVGIAGQFEKPAEAALFNTVNQLAPKIMGHFDRQQYSKALIELAQLRVPVDKFFEDVMVMVDDPMLRNSRLDLLRNLSGLMNQVADISKLAK